MIECEYTQDIRNHKHCKKKAEYVINWGNKPRPMLLPYNDQNFVCEEHLHKIRKLMEGQRMEIYELDENNGRVKVEFT